MNLTLLSLGAGVQSTALALLAIDGTLPSPDAAIFADTGWEPAAVYTHLDRLEVELEAAGIPLHRGGTAITWGAYSLGGSSRDPANLQVLCNTCNAKKGVLV